MPDLETFPASVRLPVSRAKEKKNKRITPSGREGGGSSGYYLGDDSRIRFTPTLAAFSQEVLAGLATCACLQTGHAGRTNVHTYRHRKTDRQYIQCLESLDPACSTLPCVP